MGTINLPPVEPRGNKTLDEYVKYLANVFAMNQDDIQNLLEGRLSSLNIRELTANKIVTGTLLAQLVTIMSNLSGGAYIRIDGNGMVINDGSKDTFSVDIDGQVTMTGATVQTTESSYPRLELSSQDNLLKAMLTATNYIAILPDLAGSPSFYLENSLASAQLGIISSTTVLNAIEGNLQVSSSVGDVSIRAGSGDFVDTDFRSFFDTFTTWTLKQHIDSLQNQINDLQNQVEDHEDRISALESP